MKALLHWRRQKKREAEISRALPEALDLWVLVMQAGLDFQVALAHYLEQAPRDALWEELSRLQDDMRTGSSRRDALRHLMERCPVEDLRETARTLRQGIELGSSLTPILRQQARSLRQRRGFAAEKRAAVAPLKLMFPLLVFIFPTILTILFAPMALQLSQQGFLP